MGRWMFTGFVSKLEMGVRILWWGGEGGEGCVWVCGSIEDMEGGGKGGFGMGGCGSGADLRIHGCDIKWPCILPSSRSPQRSFAYLLFFKKTRLAGTYITPLIPHIHPPIHRYSTSIPSIQTLPRKPIPIPCSAIVLEKPISYRNMPDMHVTFEVHYKKLSHVAPMPAVFGRDLVVVGCKVGYGI